MSDAEIRYLKSKHWIEGRKPNFYLSAAIAKIADDAKLKKDYIRNRSFNDTYFKDAIVEYLKEFPGSEKSDILEILQDKLSTALDERQIRDKVRNLMQALRREGRIRLIDKRNWEAVDK